MLIIDKDMENNIIKIKTPYKSELQSDFEKLEMQLRTEIKYTKTDTIKLFLTCYVALVIMILGLYATILLK